MSEALVLYQHRGLPRWLGSVLLLLMSAIPTVDYHVVDVIQVLYWTGYREETELNRMSALLMVETALSQTRTAEFRNPDSRSLGLYLFRSAPLPLRLFGGVIV